MDKIDEEHLNSLYEQRKILKRRIDYNEEEIAKGFPSVHYRIDLEESQSSLRKVEEEIEDYERKQRYNVNNISLTSYKRGETFFRLALELLSEVKQLEISEEFKQHRASDLRTQAMDCLKLAIQNSYINTEIFFLLAQIYDLQGSTYEAFEYYTAAIVSNERYQAAYEARLILCQILDQEQSGLFQFLLEKDQRMLEAITKTNRRESQ